MRVVTNFTVCAELVEAPYFVAPVAGEGQGFDRLSPNGNGAIRS